MKSVRAVLYICSPVASQADAFLRACAQLGIACDRVEDCYMGLACLVNKGPAHYHAVLVALAGLTTRDREFFQLAGRRFKDTPIYVHGVGGRRIDDQGAIRAGARRAVTPEQFADLLRSTSARSILSNSRSAGQPPPEVPRQPEAPRRVAPVMSSGPLRSTAEVPPPTEPAPEMPAAADDHRFDRDRVSAVRRRVSESRQPPPARIAETKAPEIPQEDPATLLTPEELQALLGEEQSPVAPGGESRKGGEQHR